MASPSVKTFYTEGPQFANRMLVFGVVSGALTEGKYMATIASGGTGIYVITWLCPNYGMVPEAAVTSKSDNRIGRITAIDRFSVTVEMQNIVGGAAAAGDFSLIVNGSMASDPIRG